MDTTTQIQRFPFRQIATANGTNVSAENNGFRAFPYKVTPDFSARDSFLESVEKHLPKEQTFSEKDLYEAKQKSYEEGYSKGYSGAKSAETEIEKQIQTTLSDITAKLDTIGELLKISHNQNIKEIAALVLKVARKVAGTALKNEPYSEIENIIGSSLAMLFDEPNINIEVNPELVNNVSGRITLIARRVGFKNNIEICGNNALPHGSCEIKWGGGGLRSNKDEVWERIEKLYENL